MSRGFKRDHTLTQLAHEGMSSLFPGVMADSRSFVSLPKVTPHTNGKEEPHLVLWGKDKGVIRKIIFHFNRIMNGENRCHKCGAIVREYPGNYGCAPVGHWHHVDDAPAERCDCPDNGRVACPKCHSDEHVKTQFGMGNPVEGEMSK